MPSHRSQRMAEAIREVVATAILFEVADPRVRSVTVLRVELSGDLRQAKAKGVRIAILDECRDNSSEQHLKRQASRGGGDKTRGLAPMKNARGRSSRTRARLSCKYTFGSSVSLASPEDYPTASGEKKSSFVPSRRVRISLYRPPPLSLSKAARPHSKQDSRADSQSETLRA